MLSYQQFQPYESGKQPLFQFKKLRPLDEQEGIYACIQTNLRYRVSLFSNHHQVALLQALWERGVFGNIKGFFIKKNIYYCFTDVDGLLTLSDFVEREKGSKQCFNEAFCSQLIESIVNIAQICQQVGCIIKILSPSKILVREKDGFFFSLAFPFCHNLFEGLTNEIVSKEAQFSAPELLSLKNNQYDLTRRKFSKAVLYSLGLLLLFCFGYRIKSEERVLALKNSKEFTIFLKAIRKQIKVLHEGKFISKIIKILMENVELVRDNLQTFWIKYNSPQLRSLKKYVFNAVQPSSGQIYIPTVYSDHSDKMSKWSVHATIQIQGSANANVNKTELYSPQSNLYLQPNSYLYASFRKSPENIYRFPLAEPNKHSLHSKEGAINSPHFSHKSFHQQVEEQKMREEDNSSPIEIQVDWDQIDAQYLETNQKKGQSASKTGRSHMKNQPLPQIIDELEENQNEIIIMINKTLPEKQHQVSDNSKKILKDQPKLSKSLRKQEEKKVAIEKQVESCAELHGKVSLKKQFSHENQESTKNLQKNHLLMVQEEHQPEIIKYCGNGDRLSQPKLKKKKTSKESEDLQSMTLVEQQQQVQYLQLLEDAQDRNLKNSSEIKQELNRKSEAIFIILLVSFLLYRIVDYAIN